MFYVDWYSCCNRAFKNDGCVTKIIEVKEAWLTQQSTKYELDADLNFEMEVGPEACAEASAKDQSNQKSFNPMMKWKVEWWKEEK